MSIMKTSVINCKLPCPCNLSHYYRYWLTDMYMHKLGLQARLGLESRKSSGWSPWESTKPTQQDYIVLASWISAHTRTAAPICSTYGPPYWFSYPSPSLAWVALQASQSPADLWDPAGPSATVSCTGCDGGKKSEGHWSQNKHIYYVTFVSLYAWEVCYTSFVPPNNPSWLSW